MRICPGFLLFFISILLIVVNTSSFAQAQGIKWSQCYGGLSYDDFESVKPTADGGFIAIGSTDSNDSLVMSRHALSEVYVVKTDSNGKQQWYNTYGGSDDDFGYDIVQTPEGGYMFVGGTYSDDGDVTGNHGGEDVWVVKIDDKGNIEWQNCFGGSFSDEAHSISASADGDYYVAGFTSSTDGNVTQWFGGDDFWLLKIDISGFLIWQQSYGGSDNDDANAVAATPDSGCIIVGSSSSIDGEVTGNHYSEDYWVAKVNLLGNLQYEQCYGSFYTDFATGVALTTGGNYLVCGSAEDSTSGIDKSGDVTFSYGGQDFWVIKLNDTLGLIWQQSYGGDSDDVANSIVSDATDGSSYVLGYTTSNSGEVSGNHGETDAWLIQIDSSGNLREQACIGDTGNDYGNSVCVALDSNVIVGGVSNSNAGLMSTNHGGYDGFLTKVSNIATGIYTPALHAEAVVYPNPTGDYFTMQLFNTTTIKSVQLQLLDVTGRTVLEQSGQSASSYYYNKVDISSLPSGMYFLTIKINNEVYAVKKIVKN